MTQTNIDVMDIIVDRMAEGATLSKALESVYVKRNVAIPYKEECFNVLIVDFGMSNRTTNALLRGKLRTIGDVITFCKNNKITDMAGVGRNSGIELFETILDYCWDNMDSEERVRFLIKTVEMNKGNIRIDVVR